MLNTIIVGPQGKALEHLNEDSVRQVLQDLATGARAKWIDLAGQRLTSTRRDYVNGIQSVELKGLVATIELLGVLPNMVEDGAHPWDMHDTHLSGPGVQVSKTGARYQSIPFRHQTPGTLGVGGGSPMGRAYEGHPLVRNAAAMGKAIHQRARQLSPTTGQPGGAVRYGGRLSEGYAPKLRGHHTTDIYAGMIRNEKTYERSKQSTYTTFRTISEDTPDKWQHPGIEAHDLAAEVEKFADKVAPLAFAALLGDT